MQWLYRDVSGITGKISWLKFPHLLCITEVRQVNYQWRTFSICVRILQSATSICDQNIHRWCFSCDMLRWAWKLRWVGYQMWPRTPTPHRLSKHSRGCAFWRGLARHLAEGARPSRRQTLVSSSQSLRAPKLIGRDANELRDLTRHFLGVTQRRCDRHTRTHACTLGSFCHLSSFVHSCGRLPTLCDVIQWDTCSKG